MKAYEFMILLVKLANYELFPTETIINKIYEYPLEEEEISSVFTDFGYDSLNIIMNLGILVFYLLILIALMIFIATLRLCKDKSKR